MSILSKIQNLFKPKEREYSYASLISKGMDPVTWRILKERDELLKMPIRKISSEDLYDIKSKWEFNPTYWYPKNMKPRKGEAGHDDKFRYILI